MNIITQLLFGSWLEAMVGFRMTVYTYFISGISANIFGSAVDYNNNSVGASTAINGIIAAELAMIIVNWDAFNSDQLKQIRCMFTFILVLIIIMNLFLFSGGGG